MPDEQLRDYVLQRADGDTQLSEEARLYVQTAIGDTNELASALSRLDAEVEALRKPATALVAARDALGPLLAASGNPRSAVALALMSKAGADVEAAAYLVAEGAPAAWIQSAALTAPEVANVEQACAALRSAARTRADAECTVDALAADRVQFLETSLEFHDRHGTQPCPVCAETTLDDAWVVRARAALAAEQEAAGALRAARSGAHRARQTLAALVRAVDPPPVDDAELTVIAAARAAYDLFAVLPVDDDQALADHVERTLPSLRATYDALREEAVALINANDDAWRPLVADVSAWLELARADAAAELKRKAAIEARKWLQEKAT